MNRQRNGALPAADEARTVVAVLATGHETNPIMPQLPAGKVIQNLWEEGALDGAANWQSPVVLMGVGLTAVDAVLSLRAEGYTGQIIAFSRNGLLPQAHRGAVPPAEIDTNALLAQPGLRAKALWLKQVLRRHAASGGDWRAVIDALRPVTIPLWQQLAAREQVRFFKRLSSFWNVHRHRMAPEIAAVIEAEIEGGGLQIHASRRFTAEVSEEGLLSVTLQTKRGIISCHPSRVINCTGPQLQVVRSRRPLMQQLLAAGLIEPHANGVGIACDQQGRVWGNAYPRLYAIGPLLNGQWFESTAVPELREQALTVANGLLSSPLLRAGEGSEA
jgi:uncharacterized NAD(P)/FAD-binding protein YdhS